MSKNQWDKAFERMQDAADQEAVRLSQEWDVALQRLAVEWNKTAKELQQC